ncbi:MAG: cyclic pyranopterin monophosphate synthase MoaC [Nitrososphaerota archaeon]|nr:cyclic pyranopterin monophosphate synthase MoaC [Aigarchaeota archaeon]MDW8076691.1 cyclic pyranopterin monophosphate synthase MoaC [Nitrososphaerota archaeon]
MEIKQVDISEKVPEKRIAIAAGRIRLRPETVERIRKGEVEKGDPFQVARLAGIQAAKLTPLLMPLCHQLKLEHVEIELRLTDSTVEAMAKVTATEKTGVEMEALTALTVALLNIWDVLKAYEKDEKGQYPITEITNIRVVSKVKQSVDVS